jgi:hypothetical protein
MTSRPIYHYPPRDAERIASIAAAPAPTERGFAARTGVAKQFREKCF